MQQLTFLNYLYFALITGAGLAFVLGKTWVTSSSFNKEQKVRLSGTEAFWILTFSTGLLALNVTGFIDLMAIRLLVLEILCIIAIFISYNRPEWNFVNTLYVFYLFWLFIGLTYSPSISYGFRVILKYLFPFLILLTASVAVRHREVFIKACLGAIILGIICIAFRFIPYLGNLTPGVWWYATAKTIHFISLIVLCLSLSYFTKAKTKYRLLALLFLLPCFIWVFRTSIFGSFVALSAFSIIKYRFKAVPIILLLLALGVTAIFAIPSLHEKMFKKESQDTSIADLRQGQISTEDINDNAREGMWTHLYNKLYIGHEYAGSGTGSVQNYMYTNARKYFGGLSVPHNDYLQILCDNGIIGLIIYISIYISIFFHSLVLYRKSTDPSIKICSLTAGAAILGVAVTLYSDNAVNYSMATLSMPFGFYGMCLGLMKGKEKQSI